MPSDIERHRKSKQHMESFITTVRCDSPEGVALLERSKLNSQGVKRKNASVVGEEHEAKRPRNGGGETNLEEGRAELYMEDSSHPMSPTLCAEAQEGINSIEMEDSLLNDTSLWEDFEDSIEDQYGSDGNLFELNSPQKIREQTTIDAYLGQPNPNINSTQKLTTAENISNSNSSSEKMPIAKDIAMEVVKLMKEMHVDAEGNCESKTSLLQTCEVATDLGEWKKIGNITELVNKVPSIQFFYDEEMEESLVRCNICFVSLSQKEKRLKDLTPYQAARKQCPSDHGNPSTGIWHGKEKTERYIRGANSDWRLLKSILRSHLLGISTTAHGRQHYLASKELEEEEHRKENALSITKLLVKCMITDVKMKAASTHYETLLTLLDDCKVDIGQRNHSRKQMLPLLVAAEAYVDEKTSLILNQEMPATLMAPHFFGVIDKGTVNRRTSQAAYVVFQNDGRQYAYPLGAPLVYNKAMNSDDEDSEPDSIGNDSAEEATIGLPDVDGGSAKDLAGNLLSLIKLKLRMSQQDLSRYCGTTADGQYQAEQFLSTIRKETWHEQLPEDLLFCQTTIWDAAHLLNLAVTDIKDDKVGTSSNFFRNFIKRANELNHLLSRGKGFAQLEISASAKQKRAVVITPFAAQRFLSSASKQWEAIEKGFEVLHAAFATIHSGADEDFPLQYKMFGQDFVSDLLGLLDISAPISQLMVLSQSVDFYHWKIVLWGNRMLMWIQDILEDVSAIPRFKKYLADIQAFHFCNVELLEGWQLTNQEEVLHPARGASILYNWKERNVEESIEDLRKFAEDLKHSCEARLSQGTSEVSLLLSECMDFERLLMALEGHLQGDHSLDGQSSGSIRCLKDRRKYLKLGKEQFDKWFNYVAFLPHVQAKAENYGRLDESCAEAVYLSFKEVMVELFWGSLREYGIGCLSSGGKPLKQHFVSLAPDSSVTGIHQPFKLTLLNGKEVVAFLDEPLLVKTLFTVKEVYSKIGPEFMIALDVAIASGGSEAIAESFYAVMGTQKQRCHQSNDIMDLRTKIDWLLPYVGNQTDHLVEGIAKKFLESHSSPLLRDPRSIENYFKRNRKSKVVHRITNESVKYPYLL